MSVDVSHGVALAICDDCGSRLLRPDRDAARAALADHARHAHPVTPLARTASNTAAKQRTRKDIRP